MTEKRRAMPRPAIKAIAASGFFCGFMTCFLAYFAWRLGSTVFIVLNAFTAALMFLGSAWMVAQLKKG